MVLVSADVQAVLQLSGVALRIRSILRRGQNCFADNLIATMFFGVV